MCLSRFSKWIFKLNGTAPAFRTERAWCFSPLYPSYKTTRAEWSEQSYCILLGLLFFNLLQHFCKKKLQHWFCLTTKSICVRVNNTHGAIVTPAVTSLFPSTHRGIIFICCLLRDACQINLLDTKHSLSGDTHVSCRRHAAVKPWRQAEQLKRYKH